MRTEIHRSAIYQAEDFPDFIFKGNEELFKVEKEGPFDYVMDFGNSRDWMRTKTRWELEMRRNGKNKIISCLSFEEPLIEREMEVITNLVNNRSRSSERPSDRAEYRNHLRIVYWRLVSEVQKRIGLEEALILAPKPGGFLIKEAFKQNELQGDFFDYQSKRMQRSDGGLMVGIKIENNNPEIKNYNNFVLFFDCLASDVSAWASMELIKERFEKDSLLKTRVLVVAAAASQRCLEHLGSYETLNYFGFGNIEAVVAIPVYHRMDKNYNLFLEDGRMVVGNMEEWTRL